jgi:type IV secretory pathway VirJ component
MSNSVFQAYRAGIQNLPLINSVPRSAVRWLGILSILIVTSSLPARASLVEETFTFGRFGKVFLYRSTPIPAHVILFVSGDGGWNLGVVDMAKALCEMDALVVGIDITRYLKQIELSKEACSYPAADFEALSQFVQKRLNFPTYNYPVLIGYSSGATLVYATLAQAPASTFRGAISMGFCPDLLLSKPFCRGSGLTAIQGPKTKGYIFQPASSLEPPWVVLQGAIDQVCDPVQTEAFVKQVAAGRLIALPKVGHGFSVRRNWMPQLKQAFEQLMQPSKGTFKEPSKEPGHPEATEVKGLPLIEVASAQSGMDSMGILLTGDGGWGVTDRGIAESLAAHGVPVVGMNSLQYFWTQRTPEGCAADITRVIRHYQDLWNRSRLILIGYSFGAEVLPFVVNHLPDEIKTKIIVIALLGPGPKADFEFHITDWLGSFDRRGSQPVVPELNKLKGFHILCFYGEEDSDAICNDLDPSLAKAVPIPGGHRFGRKYAAIVQAILGAEK